MPLSLCRFRPRRPVFPCAFLIALPALLCAPSLFASDEISGALTLTPSLSFPAPEAIPPELSPPFSLTAEEIIPPPELPHTLDLTLPMQDLWERIRNGFAMPDLQDDLVLSHQQYYLSHPEYLRRMVERSHLYLYHIVEELEKRHMPTELALLPMVESAYNPMALSAAQASGLWQFIPSTGRQYKLQQNWWLDQRRDVLASTHAALDYLQYIYEMHGDWHLALASYNWGEGAVGRAIAKNETKGLPTDYANLAVPNETRHYVPKLQALKNIFSNPQLVASLNLPTVPNQPYFRTLVTETPLDIKLAARFAGLSEKEFVALNPAHNRPVIQADSMLVIPVDRVEQFQEGLAAHDAPLSNWQTYTLKGGEKLEDLAPRFGIKLTDLKQANGLQGRIKLNPGQLLLVPTAGEADIGDLAALPSYPLAAATPPRLYSVKKGDTLFAIARKYDMHVSDLKEMNRLTQNNLRPGMRLKVSGEPPVVPASAAPARQTAERASPRPQARVVPNQKPAAKIARHTVQKGDTLFAIAKRYRLNLADLKRWNRLVSNTLKVGATLNLQPNG
ncbi:MAG: LysM peptidoglycan-binding domain-containing protein [Zoogloeaceae bacterium]|nr:LysM peptidoglycan-binding domain-containing protein [Zoogloeaceae bacterium]